jgi:glutathione S-transferase
MADLTIYLGNKNYSSWSLRPWLVLKQIGVQFNEVVIPLHEPQSKATIMKYSPAGTVPALRHGELVVWDRVRRSQATLSAEAQSMIRLGERV